MEVMAKDPAWADAPRIGVEVEIKARPAPGGGVDFELEIKDYKDGDKIDLPPDKGPFEITFDLDPEQGLDIRFDAAGPIFCHADLAACPTSLATEQLMVESCKKEKLVVVDWNYGTGKDLRYQLNFTNKVGDPMPPLDPIIRNGGGSGMFR